ncbi:MAG: helix-turn-helix domain-containing protein [Gammaproteobacteria bacterium]|nr:helix-turn-helix domain-containing protein [Gammaproteobacteria bacterium]
MQRFSTVDLPANKKVEHWNALVNDHLYSVRTEPHDPRSFDGTMCIDAIGRLTLTRASSSLANLTRDATHISHVAERFFLLHMSEQGSYSVRQRGSEAIIARHDFVFSDSTEPMFISHLAPCSAIILKIPERSLMPYVPQLDRLSGIVVSGKQGLGETVAVMLRSLTRRMMASPEEQTDPLLEDAVVRVVAGALNERMGTADGGSRLVATRRRQILRYVETKLADPRLTPAAVADEFRISDRYLRMIFAGEEESVFEYIQRRRLDEAARQLRDGRWQGHTISRIAFSWGFVSLSTFERAFKMRFGVTPRQYRRDH